jgi:hypothetical protein
VSVCPASLFLEFIEYRKCSLSRQKDECNNARSKAAATSVSFPTHGFASTIVRHPSRTLLRERPMRKQRFKRAAQAITHCQHLSIYHVKWGRHLLSIPSLCNHLVPKLANNEWLCLLNRIHEHLWDRATEIHASNVADHGTRAGGEGQDEEARHGVRDKGVNLPSIAGGSGLKTIPPSMRVARTAVFVRSDMLRRRRVSWQSAREQAAAKLTFSNCTTKAAARAQPSARTR